MPIRPMIEAGLMSAVKSPTALSAPSADLPRDSALRVSQPAISGITTYKPTESRSVSQGTVMSVTPSRSATMGAKATTMMRSFAATCTSV